MSDFHDKPPLEQRQIVDRSVTFQDLFDSERRGIAPQFRAEVVSELGSHAGEFENAWRQNFTRLKDSLSAQKEGHLTPDRRAQLEIMSQQLDDLNDMKPGERIALFKAFRDNSTHMAEARTASNAVREAITAGFLPAAESSQRKVIDAVGQLNPRATMAVIFSTEKVLARETDPEIKAALQRSLDDARSVLAAPFIEGARMGAILLNNKKPYQAEAALDNALAASVPGAGWQLQANRDLRQNVKEKTQELHVQNNLSDLFEKNLAVYGSTEDRHIDADELKAAAGKGDENVNALTKFLTENYAYLTRHHWPIVSKPGISDDDIKAYVQERSRQINDLRLH